MKNKRRNLFFTASLVLSIFSLVVLILSKNNEAYASFLNKTSGDFLRNALLLISNRVPFSLFELLIFFAPAFFVFFLYLLKKAKGNAVLKRFLSVFAVFLLLFSLSVNTFFISFGTKEDYHISDFSESDIRFALSYLKDKINECDFVVYQDAKELSSSLFSAFSNLKAPEIILTREAPVIKKIKNEALASRLGILGLYSPITSEINVNFSAPEYTACFSAAHEMAHLFGVAREGEASFLGYLASLETNESGTMYSAYLSAFEALFSETYSKNPALASEIYESLSDASKNDLHRYRNYYFKYHGALTDAADEINGEFLDFAAPNKNADYGFFTKLLINRILSENLSN